MLVALPASFDSLAGFITQRDKVILLLGFTNAFRRSELSALNIEDLTFLEVGLSTDLYKAKSTS
ncbi:hypothetical protein GCM10027346_40770 [Hymenobacter seoulensis]